MTEYDRLADRLRRLFAARAEQPMPGSLGERLHRVGAGDAGRSVWRARWMQFAVTAAIVAMMATAVSVGHFALSGPGRGPSPSPPAVTTPATSPSVPSPSAAPQRVAPSGAMACSQRLVFTDRQHGWLAEPTGSATTAIFATSDGGTSWTRQLSLASLTVQLDFVSASDGWVLAQTTASGASTTQPFLRTTDGGATWVRASLPGQPLACVDFVTGTVGFALTQTGRLERTADGGSTWTGVDVGAGMSAALLCFESSDQGWAVAGSSQGGAEGIYLTDDGGESWQLQYSASWLRGSGIGCSGPTVWVRVFLGAGAGSTFWEYVRTTDGGGHWTPPASPTPTGQRFLDMGGPFQVVDPSTVEIAGGSGAGGGALFETVPNNQPGTPSASLHPTSLSGTGGVGALSFINPQVGWVLVGGPEVTNGTTSDREPARDFLAADRRRGNHQAILTGGCGSFIDDVYSTGDGGRTWRRLADFTYTISTSLCTGSAAP